MLDYRHWLMTQETESHRHAGSQNHHQFGHRLYHVISPLKLQMWHRFEREVDALCNLFWLLAEVVGSFVAGYEHRLRTWMFFQSKYMWVIHVNRCPALGNSSSCVEITASSAWLIAVEISSWGNSFVLGIDNNIPTTSKGVIANMCPAH